MAQWTEEKRNTWKLIDDKVNQLDDIRNKEAGVSSGDIPVYKDGMTPEDLQAKIEERCKMLRQDLFRESVVLVDLLRIFHAYDT